MRPKRYGLLAAYVLAAGASFPCCAQTPPGPRTLEGLVNSGEPQVNAVPETEQSVAAPKRPAGTVARPEDGVQHPDLDEAWADYDEIIAEAAATVRTAIAKQLDAAANNGDLDAVEKWQAAMDKFENDGEVPAATETKAAVTDAVKDYKKAKEKLIEVYEAVQKSLTIDRRIDEAKLVREEAKSLSQTHKSVSRPQKAAPNPPQPVPTKKTLAATLQNSSWSWDRDGEITFLPNEELLTRWSGGRQSIGRWYVDGTTVVASWDGFTHRLTFDLSQGTFVSIRTDGTRSTGVRTK